MKTNLFDTQPKEIMYSIGTPEQQIKNEIVTSKTVSLATISDDQIETLGFQHAQKLSTFSDKILKEVKTSDLDTFGNSLNELVTTAKGLDPTRFRNTGFIFKLKSLFTSVKDKMLAEYSTVESRMDQLINEMDKNTSLFSRRISDLEQMSVDNRAAHDALEDSKEEGERMLALLQEELIQKEQDTSDSFAAQEVFKMKSKIDRLQKKIDDINRTMMLSKQIHPQIEILKNNSRTLSAKFQDVKVTTIPAWKMAFSLYIVQMEQKKGAELANNIHDATDAAFRMQADLMRQNVQEIAKANNRSVVSYEVLEHVNKQLLGAFDDMEKISTQAKQDRLLAEPKIKALETELINSFSRKQLKA